MTQTTKEWCNKMRTVFMVLFASVSAYAQQGMTEQQFKDFVLAEIADYDQALNQIAAESTPLSNELDALCIPPPEVRNTSRMAQLTDQLEDLDDQWDEKFFQKKNFLKSSQQFCKSTFGKDLLVVVPIPGPTDFGLAAVLAIDTFHEFGITGAVGDLVTSLMPDLVQFGNLALGGAITGGAAAATSLADSLQRQQDWIDKYNEVMQATDPMRTRIRTRHGTVGAIAELDAAIIEAQLQPSMVITDDDVKTNRDRAKNVQHLQFLKGFLQDAQEFDQWQKHSPADIDWNGVVNGADWNIFFANYGRNDLGQYNSAQSQWVNSGDFGDMDLDGDCDFEDFLIFNQYY